MGFVASYMNSVASNMLNTRLREITEKANPPFMGAGSGNGYFINTMTEEAWSIGAGIKENNVKDALQTITKEIERVNKFGFTASEYERAKTNYLTMYENIYNERDKVKNGNYAQEYVRHFTIGEAIPGIEMEYNIINNIVPQIPVEKINQYIQQLIGDKNIVITMVAPEKEDVVVPAKEQLLAWFQEAKQENIQPYEDKVNNEPLIKDLPKGGSIKSESIDQRFGTTNYVLSNGVKVIIKPTSFKDDEIRISATSPGGSSHFPDTEKANIDLYGSISGLGGLGTFSQTDLSKILAGKRVSVSPTIDVVAEGFTGSSTPKDFETALQLIYLNFTAPRIDEDAYQSFMTRIKSQLEMQDASPYTAFVDTMFKVSYNNQVRNQRLKASDLEKVNYQTIMNWRNDRYKDAGDFTFVLVGNIDPVAVKPLIAQYLGALPSINRKESFVKIDNDFKKGIIKNDFNKEMENPKATVLSMHWGTIKPTMADKIKLNMLQQILTIVYQEKMREDEGGTYGVSVTDRIDYYPKGRAILQMSFETDPEKKDLLVNIMHQELTNLTTNPPRMEDFNKTKEFLLKSQQENEQENGYWNGIILNYYKEGYDGYTDFVKTVNSIQPKDIQEIAKILINQNNFIEVIMTGIK